MHRFLNGLTAAATAAFLITGMIAMSARSACAQQSDQTDSQYEGSFGANGAVAQPDKPAAPLDLNGCWSGTIEDVGTPGSGNGYLNFDQPKAKNGNPARALKPIKSTTTHNLYFDWSDGSYAYGFGSGAANSKVFHARINTGKGVKCGVVSAAVTGALSGNALIGAYNFRGCPKSFGKHAGTFTLAFDATGGTCNGTPAP
ncbi:MAG: hypothetical protein ACYDC3_18195 [Candidatus Binataceae bacterium]